MVKKIVLPIIYALFVALVLFFDTVVLAIIQMELEVAVIGTIILCILFVGVSILLFWLANKVMLQLEKLHRPKIVDHFRQSSICYLVLILAIIYTLFLLPEAQDANGNRFVRPGYYWGMGYLMTILVWAIFINGIFLYKRHKAKIRHVETLNEI